MIVTGHRPWVFPGWMFFALGSCVRQFHLRPPPHHLIAPTRDSCSLCVIYLIMVSAPSCPRSHVSCSLIASSMCKMLTESKKCTSSYFEWVFLLACNNCFGSTLLNETKQSAQDRADYRAAMVNNKAHVCAEFLIESLRIFRDLLLRYRYWGLNYAAKWRKWLCSKERQSTACDENWFWS